MSMQPHHKLALLGAAGTSAMALSDAVIHGLTGHYSVFADTSGNAPVQALGDLVHGLTYLALSFVLVAPVLAFTGTDAGTPSAIWSGIAGIAFIGMILGSLVLGLALLPNRALEIDAHMLVLILSIAELTALIA